MKTIVFEIIKKSTFNHETSELSVEIFRKNPRLPLAKNLEKAFYSLPNGEYMVHIHKQYCTILHGENIVKDIKVKPYLSETEWELAYANCGVLILKYRKNTLNRINRLLSEGVINNFFCEDNRIIINVW